MSKTIDLNSDLGESFGAYTIGMDEEVLGVVTSANVACGYHAGDHNVMARTVRTCREKEVGVGAHPGLPDLIGFGRRKMDVDPDDVYHFVAYQIGALEAFCKIEGIRMQHVKPHGALYNIAGKDLRIAEAIAQAVHDASPEAVLFGLAGSELLRAGDNCGLKTASEVFADRTYQGDGSLTPRSEANAMISDSKKAVEQVLRMINDGETEAVDGTVIPIEADTICVHGDGPKAVEFVRLLRRRLEDEGILIQRVGV
ncbi:MAG TPA: 5-oxoprolinase subunit PxpA [Bacillales bacterium]